jgi:hypothetical protein
MGRKEPGDSHPVINEWGVAWAVPGKVSLGWTGLSLVNLCMNPELSLLLACSIWFSIIILTLHHINFKMKVLD